MIWMTALVGGVAVAAWLGKQAGQNASKKNTSKKVENNDQANPKTEAIGNPSGPPPKTPFRG